MRVSFDWIREFVDIGMGAEEAAHALTMSGLEVEAVEKSGSDHVFEVNVTPNRPDCLSVAGIAREFSAITGSPLRLPETTMARAAAPDFSIGILDESLCRRYAGRIVRGISIGRSPDWMAERLEKCGIRTINNIVDITNYVLLEFGHPLHAFDLDKLRGNTIRVGVAGSGTALQTLDGLQRSMPEDALMIWDAERPVAVAGVMGGAETEVSDKTKDILIESAWFLPGSVRRTSKALGLSTEASIRFERGTDIVNLEAALDRAASLVVQVAGGVAEGIVDAYPSKFSPRSISVKRDKVNRVLGTALSAKEIAGLLARLAIKTKGVRKDSMTVVQPPHRPDIESDIDVIEEVARIHGYANIPTIVPCASIAPGKPSRRPIIDSIRQALGKDGYHDAINLSFLNTSSLDKLKLPLDDRRRSCVRVQNPLRAEDSHLRSLLAPSLIENLARNISRGVRDVRLYEIARVFEATDDRLPLERLHLGGIFSKDRSPSLYRETAEDYYLVKGTVESVLDRLRVGGASFEHTSEPFLHPGKSADVFVGGDRIGYLGLLMPDVSEAFGLKPGQEALVFEADVDVLLGHMPTHVVYSPIARFPAVERDIAMLLDEGVKAADVIAHVRAFGSGLIEDAKVFDSYRGKNIAPGKKSLAVSVRYRSQERTLKDEEVEAVHSALVEHLVGKTGGEVRGAKQGP